MKADDARSVGIQRGVQDFAKGIVHIGLEITDRLGIAEKKRNLGHNVLSALRLGPSMKLPDWSESVLVKIAEGQLPF